MYTKKAIVAMAAIALPDTFNTSIDIGWNEPVNEGILAVAFEGALKKLIQVKSVIPSFVLVIKWIDTGVYISKKSTKVKRAFWRPANHRKSVRQYYWDR